jgi:hypothetical protein
MIDAADIVAIWRAVAEGMAACISRSSHFSMAAHLLNLRFLMK